MMSKFAYERVGNDSQCEIKIGMSTSHFGNRAAEPLETQNERHTEMAQPQKPVGVQSIENGTASPQEKTNVCVGILKWRLVAMSGDHHILSSRVVQSKRQSGATAKRNKQWSGRQGHGVAETARAGIA